MKIENVSTTSINNPLLTSKDTGGTGVTLRDATSSQVSLPINNSTSVSISGKALMLSRLFGGTPDTPVAAGASGMDVSHIGMSPQNFLTESDKSLLSDMYAYAQQQGADLQYVDAIATGLGDYRQHDNGRKMFSFNNGQNLDSSGHVVTVNFNEQDSVTAKRILDSNAMNSTQLDQGYLRYVLDPGYGALTNTGDFAFLEKMVNKFSGEADATQSLDSTFSLFSQKSVEERVVFTSSKETSTKITPPDGGNTIPTEHPQLDQQNRKLQMIKYTADLRGFLIAGLLGGRQDTNTQLAKLLDMVRSLPIKNKH